VKKLILSSGLLLLLLIPVVSASAPITGGASRCSGLASCTYTLTSSSGTGSASTNAGVGGYVGQSPLYFSGGTVNFKLPGEAAYTYTTSAYSGLAVLDGYSSTAGTLYHVTGTFKAVDVNTGTIVTGSTDGIVGIKGHSGRGGGNYYTVVSGTITFVQSALRGSKTSLVCSPSPVTSGGTTTCTVTVTDPGAGSASTPTGTITFTQSSYTGWGSFSPAASCSLVSGTCSVSYTLSNGAYYNAIITASYGGDGVHVSSSATVYVPITGGGGDD
jgi:hypothetical protein